jgi:hypothetical protein
MRPLVIYSYILQHFSILVAEEIFWGWFCYESCLENCFVLTLFFTSCHWYNIVVYFTKKMPSRVPKFLGEFNGKICSECISYNLPKKGEYPLSDSPPLAPVALGSCLRHSTLPLLYKLRLLLQFFLRTLHMITATTDPVNPYTDIHTSSIKSSISLPICCSSLRYISSSLILCLPVKALTLAAVAFNVSLKTFFLFSNRFL